MSGVLEVPGQEGSYAVGVAHVYREQPAPLRRVGVVPLRPSRLRARDTDQPVPRGIQTPAHSAPVRGTDGRQVVVETDPGLRITGPASVRNDQRRRQSPDEFVTVRHDRTFERMLRTLQLGPTGSDGGRNVSVTDERPGPPGDLGWPSSYGAAAVGCGLQADVAQLVERVHGKEEVNGSTPAVGSVFYRNVTAVRYHFCPRLSSFVHRTRAANPSTGVKNGALPRDRASLGSQHGKEGVGGSSPRVGLSLLPQRPQQFSIVSCSIVRCCPRDDSNEIPAKEQKLVLSLDIERLRWASLPWRCSTS